MKNKNALFSAILSMLIFTTGCQTNETDTLDCDSRIYSDDGISEVVFDLPDGEKITLNVYEPSGFDDPEEMERLRQEWWDTLEEQKAKYGPLLPLEYEDWMPEGTYGIMSDIGYMLSYMTYGVTADDAKRDFDIYIDRDGNRFISVESLNTEKAEIVFEDGTPATEDDITPGTAMLVQNETVLETFPGEMICNKIIILQ